MYQDGLLAFQSSEALKLRKTIVLTPGYTEDVELEVDIISFEPESALYRGKVEGDVYFPDSTRSERRKERRFESTIRVTSSVIPGYEAHTEDISLGGARLQLKKKTPCGLCGSLTLHLDDPELPDLVLHFEFRWCAEKRDGSFHSGIQFHSVQQSDKRILTRFLDKHALDL